MKDYEIIIKPKKSLLFIDLIEMWRYRDLLFIFAWRDIKVRYKQTMLGVGWAILQPIVTMVVFTIFFGNLAKIPSGKMPYSLFVLCGLVFWSFFSNALSHASNSMVDNESIVKKVYFPKLILPLSAIITSSIDLAINFLILMIFATVLGFIPSLWILIVIPLALILASITIAGMSLFLASFNVKYRDVRYILPFFIQISGSGLVAPCGMLFNKRYQKFHMGNIVDTSFKKIWKSERYWKIIDYLASKEFNAQKDCGTLCLQHKVNEYVWDLKKKNVKLSEHKGNKPNHINFI